MAADYSIRLQAVLDTNQVQQELQKLRTQQQSTSASGAGASRAGLPNGGNLTGISSIFQRLNQSIVSLQRSIDALNKNTIATRNVNSAANGKSSYVPPIAGNTSFSTNPAVIQIQKQRDIQNFKRFKEKLIKHTPEGFYDFVNSDRYLSYRDSPTLSKDVKIRLDRDLSGFRNAALKLPPIRNIFGLKNGSTIDADLFITSILNDKQSKAILDEYLNSTNKQVRYEKRMRSMMKLLGGQMIAGSLIQAGENIGGFGGTVVSGAGSAIQEGMMGGIAATMMGAHPGLAVGVGLAQAAASISESMLKYAQMISRAQEESYQILQRSRSDIRSYQKQLGEFRFSEDLKSMDHNQIKELKAAQEEEVRKNKEQYLASDKDIKARQYAINAAYLRRMNDPDLDQTEKVEIEREHAMDMKQLSDSLQKVKDKYDESQKKLDEINAAEEAWKSNLKTLANLRNSTELNAFTKGLLGKSEAQISDEAKQSTEKLDKMKAEYSSLVNEGIYTPERMEQLAALNKQISDEETRNKLLVSSKSSFDAADKSIEEQLDTYKQRTMMNGLRASLIKPEFNEVVRQLDEARWMRREYGEKAIEAYSAAKSDSISQKEKEDLIKDAEKWQKQEGQQTDVIGVLEQALTRVSQNTGNFRPDMTPVTSLAAMGFNMGENEDMSDIMRDYYSESLNVQKQIKSKLDEGIDSEARYAN